MKKKIIQKLQQMCDKLPKGKERKSIFKKLVKLKTEKQMDYFELECAVEQWAEEKEIFDKATPVAQALKTLEETTELCTAINKNDRLEIIDAMGDIMVTLIIQAHMQDISLQQCLESAYNVINKRTGKMIDGQFVKDK